MDVPISKWRFMRQEKIPSYWSKFVELFVQLRATEFCEEDRWFNVPENMSLVLGVYFDRRVNGYVGGIVTQPAVGNVLQIHKRMPYLAQRWWTSEYHGDLPAA